MDLLSSTNLVLLIIGLIVLVINIVFSAVRVSRGHLRAGLLNVVLTLAACVLIAIGLVRITFPATPVAAAAPSTGFAGRTTPNDGQGQQSSGENTDPNGQQPAINTTPGAQQGAPSGTLPPRLATSVALGTPIQPRMLTAIAGGSGGGGGGGQGFGDGSSNNGSSNGGASSSGTPSDGASSSGQSGNRSSGTGGAGSSSDRATGNRSSGSGQQAGSGQSGGGQSGSGQTGSGQFNNGSPTGGPVSAQAAVGTSPETPFLPLVTIAGGIILVAGIALFLAERRRAGFEPSVSPGLLYVGAGVFILVAALVVPILPGQFTVARASAAGRLASGAGNRLLATRADVETATPSMTVTPTETSTAVPSLTPAPQESPTPMFTAVAYANSTDVGTTTTCSVTAQAMLNLRGDPSVQQMAIGKIFAGSLLPVTGQTADKKWLRVLSGDGTSRIEGWVSADYVTFGTGCTDGSVPVVGPTATTTRTPSPTRTLPPTQTPRPSATPRP